ncbi:MAG: hypothetical protein HFF06_02345 [Oscillospiraceae bacterium]|jgi:hypothetical protein|nr:hypothetical protein [Oscillospiraceae bacterium]
MEKLFLAAKPGEINAAGGWGWPLAHLAYRVGGGPHLFRANGPVTPQGGLMVIDDAGFSGGGEPEGFCNEVLRECAARRFRGVVCRFLERPAPVLAQAVGKLGELCGGRGLELYVSEGYAGAGGGGRILISTALSGGSLRGRLEEARERYGHDRLALWVERRAEDFLLPSPSGAGSPLTAEELERRRGEYGGDVFFSAELCAHYFTYMAGEKGHFVLFDDVGSIRKKLRLGEELGIRTAFLEYGDLGEDLGELKDRN